MKKELKEIIELSVWNLMKRGDEMVGFPSDAIEVLLYNTDEFWEQIRITKCEFLGYTEDSYDMNQYNDLRNEIFGYAYDCYDDVFEKYQKNKEEEEIKNRIKKCKKMMNESDNYYEQRFWLSELRELTNNKNIDG